MWHLKGGCIDSTQYFCDKKRGKKSQKCWRICNLWKFPRGQSDIFNGGPICLIRLLLLCGCGYENENDRAKHAMHARRLRPGEPASQCACPHVEVIPFPKVHKRTCAREGGVILQLLLTILTIGTMFGDKSANKTQHTKQILVMDNHQFLPLAIRSTQVENIF